MRRLLSCKHSVNGKQWCSEHQLYQSFYSPTSLNVDVPVPLLSSETISTMWWTWSRSAEGIVIGRELLTSGAKYFDVPICYTWKDLAAWSPCCVVVGWAKGLVRSIVNFRPAKCYHLDFGENSCIFDRSSSCPHLQLKISRTSPA